jgi:hypothetical protein
MIDGVSEPVVFVGGMNVPVAGGGRFNASVPLAELTIDTQQVVLQARWFAAMFTQPLTVPLPQITVAFPVRGWLSSSGVGLSFGDGEAYFWTLAQREQVLHELGRRGVPIDPSVHKVTLFGNRRPTPPGQPAQPPPDHVPPSVPGRGVGAVPGAQLRGWLAWWIPIGGLLSVPVLFWLLHSPGPRLWHAWIVGIWIVGLVTNLRLWKRARRRR